MPILNFPLNPAIGNQYTIPGTTTVYQWNGAAWLKVNQGDQNVGNLNAGSATIGANSNTAVVINQNGSITVQGGSLNVTNTSTLGNITFFASSITNTLGNLLIQSPKDTNIVLNNNTLVNGNLHATGNITANGSVQIGNQTGSDTLSLFADIVSNITPQTPNTYDIGNPKQTWANGYFENLVSGNFSSPVGKDVNLTPSKGGITNINSDVRIWGQNPLGTAPVVSNILYVSMDGSDTNDGRAADATRACRTITGAVRSPYYKEGTSIKVAPGHYYEDNPIELKPYTSVIGSDLRTTSVEPINKTQDLFHVQSGCYLNYMQFTNGQSGLLPGSGYNASSNRGAYATAFPPNYGGTKIDVFHSPYIQNCTNQSGPWLYDGTMFQPNQTVQVPESVGTATWTLNTTTMIVHTSEGTISVGQSVNVGPTPIDYVNARTLLLANKPFIQEQVIAYVDQNNTYYGYDKTKCIRDTRLIVDSLVTDLVFGGNGLTQSNFAGLQYWNQDGYTGDITSELSTTTAAINYISSIMQDIVQNNLVVQNQFIVPQDTSTTPGTFIEAQKIASEFSLIVDILNNGTSGVTDIVSPSNLNPTSFTAENAVTTLLANKTFIQEQAVAFVEATRDYLFVYDQAKCYRDVGYMVDSIAFDLLYGGNRQAIQSAVYYYGFSGTASAIPTERPQTTAAYYRIREILSKLLTNQPIIRSPGNLTSQITNLPVATQSEIDALKAMVDKITEIINAGPDAADAPTPISITKSGNTNILKAAEILQANKGFITSEVISYIDQTYNNGFAFNQPKCSRDTGLIVDSIAVDLLYGGATQSTFAGLQYWNQNGYTGIINTELTTTTNAINYVKTLAQQIITNSTGTRYQNSVTQVTGTTATNIEAEILSTEFSLINSIILNGTAGVTDVIVPNGSASTATNVVNAYTLLQANKVYIQTEAVAFVENQKTVGFVYDQAKCYRDVGYMVDSVSFDLLHGGNRQAVQSGVYYYSFNGDSTAIANEIPQTISAYNHIRNIVGKIITGAAITPTVGNTATQVTNLTTATSAEVAMVYNNIDVITNIINNGPSVATEITSITLNAIDDSSIRAAYELLLANREFIQAETIAFVSQFSTGFVYNRAKCKRDIGIIVENIAYDIAFGGNQKAVESGLAYWSGVTSVIPGEISTTTNAIEYIGTLAQQVISNTTATNLLSAYQTAPQVINTVLVGGGTAAPAITKLINVINGIINDGPGTAPAIQVGNGPDWGSVSAEVLLQANRKFIQSEIINWVNNTFPDFVYNEATCYRDTGLIVDAISQDIILNSNAKTIEAAVTYWTGNINAVAGEIVETTAAINRAKQIALQIINNTTVTSTSFVFNSVKCSRDTGLIVDALAQDVLFGGNSQSTFAGIQYWNHGGYVGNILSEITTTTAAVNYLKSIAEKILVNDTSSPRYQNTVTQVINLPAATTFEVAEVSADFTVITDILTNGVAGVTDRIVPNSINPRANPDVQHGYDILQANKEYMQAEVIAWIDDNMRFRYDETKCARDSGLIVDSIALDLAYPSSVYSQSTFAGLQYWDQNGYTGQIAGELTTTTNAINYVKQLAKDIIQNVTGGPRYQSAIAQQFTSTPASDTQKFKIDSEFTYITNILTNGTAGVTDLIVSNDITPSSNPDVNAAYELLQLNREYIQAEAVAFVEATKSVGFVYDKALCSRDVGYMLDSVSFDLLHGGNRQAIQSGVYYYSFNAASTAIPDEVPQTVAAFEFIKVISQQIAQNVTVTPLQDSVQQLRVMPAAGETATTVINDAATRIISIIENGPTIVGIKEPIGLAQSSDQDRLNAASNLMANKEFIKAEVIAYLNYRFKYQYDQTKCYRDVGYMVDSVSFDLLYGGNRQAIQSGVYYYGYNGQSTSLPSERVASTQAYDYMKALITDVVSATPTALRYQNSIPQTTNLPAATQIEIDAITANIDLITTIINDGPDVAPAATNIPLTRSINEFVNNAAALLEANRDFIRAEVIAYVQSNVNDQVFLSFYDKGANATLSVIRNFDIISNIIENGVGVAPPVFDGNGIFVKSGLSRDNIPYAPTVTSVTPLGGNAYKINVSQSSVGYGDGQTLYFGTTAVYPLLDADVPDRWQQRRLNPIGSMGGSLVDGGVVSDRSPITSFVYDAFTQVNQGGNGIKITNNGYAQLVSVFTIFCSNAVTVENGGIASITNSNSNFGDICLSAKGYGKREFSGYIKNPPVAPYFPNGVYPQGGEVVVYIADPQLRPHIALVMEVEPPVGHVNNQGLPGFLSGNTNVGTLTTGSINITGVDTTGVVIGQKFYVKDQYGRQVDENNQPYVTPGTIIADVNYQTITLNYPLNSGGGDANNSNYFNLYSCGNAYYTVLSSTVSEDPITPGTFLLPGLQGNAEINAINYLNSLSQKIITNQPITPLQTATTQVLDFTLNGAGAGTYISNELSLINSILENGPSSAPTVQKYGTVPAGTVYADAAGLLLENKTFLQDEIIQYVDDTFRVFIYDQDKCYRDTGLIVDAIAQDLVFGGTSQSTFAGIQYWNQSGYVGAIANELTTTTNAINYVSSLAQQVVQNITGGTRYQSSLTQATPYDPATSIQANSIAANFNVITNILANGTVGVTDIIIPNSLTPSSETNVQNAYALLQANKAYIQAEAIAYIEQTKTSGFAYDQTKCRRDVGYMIDSICTDLRYGGNRQSVQSGVYYYGYSGSSSAIPGETVQTKAAYNYIKSILSDIIVGTPLTTTYQTDVSQLIPGDLGSPAAAATAQSKVDTITNIIANGPKVAAAPTSLGLTASNDSDILNSAAALEINRAFIQAETVAYINNTFGSSFNYNQTKCARDTGLIVDALAQDLLFTTSSQATFAGLQYWDQAGYTGAIEGELTTTTNTINYVSSLVQEIIVNVIGPERYTSESQITGIGGTVTESDTVATDFALIVDILANGTIGVTDRIVPNNLTADTNINVQNAYDLIQANRTYIQDEAIAFVENYKTLNDPSFVYDQALCRRDVGYMIDSVCFDLLYGGNRQAIQSGVYYYAFNSGSTAVPNEIIEVTAAYDHIKSISQQIILGQDVITYQSIEPQVTNLPLGTSAEVALVQTDVNIITNIVNNGPSVVTNKTPINLTRSTNQNVINAALMLAANREFIKAETIAYINRVFGAYNKEKCRRDVGLLIDALVYDLDKGGNYNAIVAGKSYYATHGTHHLVQLEDNVTDPALFPDGAIINFYQRSYMSASGYLFEYVGAGTNYGALPQVGVADPVQSKETVQLNNGKVFFTSTDQNGDFRIGTGLVISQATGVLSGRTFTKSLFANLTPFILAIEG